MFFTYFVFVPGSFLVQDRIDALTERVETCSAVGDDKSVRESQDSTDFGVKTKRGMQCVASWAKKSVIYVVSCWIIRVW